MFVMYCLVTWTLPFFNGYTGDDISVRSFDNAFAPSNSQSWFKAVGFLSISRNTLHNHKVRWYLGAHGVSEVGSERMELLEKDYVKTAVVLEKLGSNARLLDLWVS